ncbi:MAG TPA: AarF/UbiB family protein [Acidimicrobiales bacterium]|nr:AarF/UbiB family protein [Acidimicrobiales bacterium]
MTSLQLLESLQASSWIASEPGLADAAAQLADSLAGERATLDRHAARLARPGLVPPIRAARHLASLTAARWRWQYTRLPFDLLSGRPLNDTGTYAKETIAAVLRDHLAGLGAPAAEIARIVDGSEGLLPGVVVEEVRKRPVTVRPMSGITVEAIATRAFGERVQAIEPDPLVATAVSQVHRAKLADDGRSVLLRVRRPGVDRALRADARITATLVGPLELLLPALRDPHPLGFVELSARQALEEADLRNEALNAIELAMAAERLGLDGLAIPHPVPGLVAPRAVVFEDLGVTPLAEATIDREQALRSYLGITLESALTSGVFHADLRPEHLVATDAGQLSIVGFGTVGRFSLDVRRGALKYLTSVFSGDVRGQIDAMEMTGAVPDGVDIEALAADLAASEALQPMTMLTGGEGSVIAGLKEAVNLLLKHHLRPPMEVTLFVRNVFALNAFVRELGPDITLMSALMPLVQRLPELAAELGVAP